MYGKSVIFHVPRFYPLCGSPPPPPPNQTASAGSINFLVANVPKYAEISAVKISLMLLKCHLNINVKTIPYFKQDRNVIIYAKFVHTHAQ